MKKLLTALLCVLMVLSVFGCSSDSESGSNSEPSKSSEPSKPNEPECAHEHTTTTFEISLLNIVMTVTCDDCGERLSREVYSEIAFIYDKVLVDENGIKLTLLNAQVDGWGSVTLNFEVEGTSSSKRMFTCTNAFINGYETTIWIYTNGLCDNKKSLEEEYLLDLKAENFLASQDYDVELDYSILNESNYRSYGDKEVHFNLNEYISVEEVKD